MSRKSICMAVVALAVIFFVTGWLSYGWVLHRVTIKNVQPLMATSVQDALNHRLMMSLSFALVGAITGFGTLLSGRFSPEYRYERSLLILLVVAVLATSAGTAVLTKKFGDLADHLSEMNVPVFPEASLLLSEVHLHEIGIFGSWGVLIAAIILAIFPIDGSRGA